jgi:hypothetical protein
MVQIYDKNQGNLIRRRSDDDHEKLHVCLRETSHGRNLLIREGALMAVRWLTMVYYKR